MHIVYSCAILRKRTVLFGFTGAHLAYTKERLLLGVHLIWITVPVAALLAVGAITNDGLGIGAVLLMSFFASYIEASVAKCINLLFGTSFLDKDK